MCHLHVNVIYCVSTANQTHYCEMTQYDTVIIWNYCKFTTIHSNITATYCAFMLNQIQIYSKLQYFMFKLLYGAEHLSQPIVKLWMITHHALQKYDYSSLLWEFTVKEFTADC